ncbi:MAG: malonyl-CoA decarboxylase [Gemmatimonadota bacterium]
MGKPGFLGRQIQNLQKRWQAIAGAEYGEDAAGLRPHLPKGDRSQVKELMRQSLDRRGGEILARSRAAALGRVYLSLNPEGRWEFLRMLARDFDVQASEVREALTSFESAATPGDRQSARRRLLSATEPPRRQILTRFNALPQGVKFLVDMRADLIPLARKDPVLSSLDDDLRALLTSWFDVDFLQLQRISWNTASGALLEKFMAYEAVHPVESWEDLKNRLDHDRRYFAFFHPRMPDEPLIFLEVALVRGMADNIQDLLDAKAPVGDPYRADTAIFYSISNAQKGLAGISFGGFLIKMVVEELAEEFPGLKTFATLSPMPGFKPWLEDALRKDESGGASRVLLPADVKRLKDWTVEEEVRDWLGGLLADALWLEDKELEKAVKPILLRLAARYLSVEKREGRGALDPVAHFHLSNGARVERLNWRADSSGKGMTQSAGMMVNYLYNSRRIEKNHEAYKTSGEVAVSSSIKGLLKG